MSAGEEADEAGGVDLSDLEAIDPSAVDEGPPRPGAKGGGGGPVRRCVATGASGPAADLLRFVAGPDGRAVPDLKRRLPGRGVWVSATRGAVRLATRRGAFSRALRTKVVADEGLADHLEDLLRADAQASLALANKAGAVTWGFERVEAAALKGRLAALLHGAEAAPDGRRKLLAAARRGAGLGSGWERVEGEGPEPVPVFDPLGAADLGLALGRERVIHAGLLTGPASGGALARLQRLAGYRAGDVEPAPRRPGPKGSGPKGSGPKGRGQG